MTTHTPGPWAQAPLSPVDILAADETMIAMAREGLNGISRDQAIANARLIAAAPDLLAAVHGLLASCGPQHESETVEMYRERTALLQWHIDRASEALTKATGEA